MWPAFDDQADLQESKLLIQKQTLTFIYGIDGGNSEKITVESKI